MATNCLDTGLLKSDGTSQSQRSLDILLNDAPLVDERQMADLILFAKKYGAYLNYFDTSNNVTDTWQGLMSSDSVVIIAGISVWPTRDYAEFVKTIRDNAISAGSDTDAKKYFKVLFDFAFSLAMELNTAYNQLDPKSDYAQFLALTINSSLSTPLNALLFYYNNFVANSPSLIDTTSTFTYNPTPIDALVFSQNFNIPVTSPLTGPFNLDPAFNTVNIPLPGSVRPDIIHILTHNLFSGVYQAFIDGITNIVSRTPAYLSDLLTNSPSHTPHYALYLTFLNLFKYAQQHLNGYTKEHLDFYYKQVLELTNNPAQPDFAHLVFTLQKNITQHLIPANTPFKAGKDANNKDIFYATTNNVVLQTAVVQNLRSIWLNKDISPVTLFQAPVANSEDGQGAKLLSADGSWFPFGDPQQNTTAASLGFALASSVLYLNEGNRTVTFTFNCDTTSGVTNDDLTGIFSIQFTGAKGWYTTSGYTPQVVDGDTFSLTTTMEGDAPAIVPFAAKIHSGNFTTALPMVQVMLTSYASYQTIKAMKIATINISVTVDGVKNLILQNDDGKIDTSKPFKVFGDFPDAGASFIIGSKEIFQKQLDNLTLNFDWQQEPNSDTTVNIAALVKGNWKSINNGNVSLYASDISINDTYVISGTSFFTDKVARKFEFKPELEMEPEFDFFEPEAIEAPLHEDPSFMAAPITIGMFDFLLPAITTLGLENVARSQTDFTANAAYAATSVDGFIELQLNNTEYNLATFLGNIPQPSVTVNYDSSNPPKITGYTVSKATPPVATPPALQSVTVTYTAHDNIIFTNTSADFRSRNNAFYHIEPFGYREMHPLIVKDTPLTFLPVFNLDDGSINEDGGELWIGLANAHGDETFSVLFEVSDGSANPLKNMTEVDWYYMSANNWVQFDKQSVTDQTNNLTTSGLVIFTVPGSATTTNTRADNGLIWLKAVVEKDTDAVCNLIAVDANSVEAQFVQDVPDGVVFTSPLPPNAISKPAVADGALKQTQQPYSSFGGRVAEPDAQFYIRVSERLRHKNRAITAWDYERLTLQNFPQVFKAKCLNHTGFILDENTNTLKYSETLAGQVMVITIPDVTHLNTVNILRPYTSIGLLTGIQKYLATLTSPFVTVNVCNPQFEEVQFEFSVTFKQDYSDATFYGGLLNDAIEQFLTPWAYGDPQDINFGATIEKSVVLNFVEQQYYVDFVTCFQMNQIIRDGSVVKLKLSDIEEAVPTTARSILVSYHDAATNTKHIIHTPAKCDCQ